MWLVGKKETWYSHQKSRLHDDDPSNFQLAITTDVTTHNLSERKERRDVAEAERLSIHQIVTGERWVEMPQQCVQHQAGVRLLTIFQKKGRNLGQGDSVVVGRRKLPKSF